MSPVSSPIHVSFDPLLVGLSGLTALGACCVALMWALGHRGRLRCQQDRMAHRFLGILSHELRTPINAIMGFASILDDEIDGPLNETQHRRLRQILQGADHLLGLIDDLLVMSSIQAGKFSLNPGPIELGPLVLSVVESLRPAAEQKRHLLMAELPAPSPRLLGDELRLRQVLFNLLTNAFKFTPAGGVVTVRCRQLEARVRIEVTDTGVGIPAAERVRMFRPFTQLDMSATRPAGGTGLGLSICKALIEAHGGVIGVESERGRGSTFWFELPVSGGIKPQARFQENDVISKW